MRNRVCITGMGVVCGAGNDCDSFRRAIVNGKSCFSKITNPDLGHLKAKYAGIVDNIPHPVKERPGIAYSTLPELDRYHHLALSAASAALSSSFLTPGQLPENMAVIVGTCSGPMLSIENFYKNNLDIIKDDSRDAFFIRSYDSCSKILAHFFGISGLSATVVTACSASLSAIGTAADLIRIGITDIALVGGSDTLSPTTLAGFDGLKATTETFCAPFSKPYGLTLGEAAAFIIIENMEHALARKAVITAEIAGFGLSNDAYHCTSPDPAGKGHILAMQRALSDSGLVPENIVYINAHGTGTEANDRTETKAIRRVFGEHATNLPVSSTKSITGHCLGAAGCIETIATILGRQAETYPPTANFTIQRDGCNLDYIPDAGRKWISNGPVLTNNFAFGGNNASLAFIPGYQPVNFSHSQELRETTTEPVAITACGIVCAAGIGNDAFLSAIKSGTNAFSKFSSKRHGVLNAGVVSDFDMKRIDRGIDIRNMDKASRFAVAAARLALRDSVVFDKVSHRGDLGFFLNCSTGTTSSESDYITGLSGGNLHLNQVSVFPYVVPNSITGNVCKALMLTGHNSTFCLGPGAGLSGLGFSWNAIKNNHASAMLTGSFDELMESTLSGAVYSGYLPLGEGACIFMLETISHAKSRNADILGEICSITYSTEIENASKHDSTTTILQNTIKRAMFDAGITPSNIGAVGYFSKNLREKDVVSAIFCANDIIKIDVSSSIGYAAATAPLYNIAYALLDSSFEPIKGKNYILAVFSTVYGTNCVAVISKKIQD